MDLDISQADKVEVFAALYNKARVQGLGFLHAEAGDLDRKAAGVLMLQGDDGVHLPGDDPLYFDYVKGRVMKVDLSGNTFSTRLYDRDNGYGAAARALVNVTGVVPVRQDLKENT